MSARCLECGGETGRYVGRPLVIAHDPDCLEGSRGKAFTLYVRAYPRAHARTLKRAVDLALDGDWERFIAPLAIVDPDLDLGVCSIRVTSRDYPHQLLREIPLLRAMEIVGRPVREAGRGGGSGTPSPGSSAARYLELERNWR